MKLKFYAYKNCDTCRKAKKYLDEKGVEYELIPIREQPPTKAELKTMLASQDGNVRVGAAMQWPRHAVQRAIVRWTPRRRGRA